MKLKYIIILLAIVLFANDLFAQEQQIEQKSSFALFFVPQYVIANGIRIDIDYKPKGTYNWWIFSPYYYSDGSGESILNPSDNAHTYKSMYGLGLGISRRVMLTGQSGHNGFYFKFGAEYKYFDIQGDNFTYVQVVGDDGLTYHRMQDIEYTIIINNFAGNLCIGHQFNPFSKFYIDLFIGFGLKYSVHSSPENVSVEYNRGGIDYGYTGTQLLGGFRIGIGL